MNQKPLPGIPEQILQSADQMMEQIQSGKIRKPLLGSTSHVHDHAMMNVSVNSYCDFVKSKLFFDIIKLKGEETHE